VLVAGGGAAKADGVAAHNDDGDADMVGTRSTKTSEAADKAAERGDGILLINHPGCQICSTRVESAAADPGEVQRRVETRFEGVQADLPKAESNIVAACFWTGNAGV